MSNTTTNPTNPTIGAVMTYDTAATILAAYTVPTLRTVARAIGAPSAKCKAALVDAIIATDGITIPDTDASIVLVREDAHNAITAPDGTRTVAVAAERALQDAGIFEWSADMADKGGTLDYPYITVRVRGTLCYAYPLPFSRVRVTPAAQWADTVPDGMDVSDLYPLATTDDVRKGAYSTVLVDGRPVRVKCDGSGAPRVKSYQWSGFYKRFAADAVCAGIAARLHMDTVTPDALRNMGVRVKCEYDVAVS